MPANYAFTAGDAGSHSFSATLKTAGSRSITATDTATGSINGAQSGITVNSAAASALQMSAPASATAGSSFNVTVTAKDAFGNTATGFAGTVHFTSSDSQAGLPANYAFTAADAGVHTFSVTLKTAGSRSVTATDTATGSLTASATLAVNAAAASTYQVSAPSGSTAGSSFNVSMTVKDAYGNTATGYTGTVHFTSSDGQAALPANYAFTAGDAGVHTFSATLKTAGSRSITATDTATATVTGSATVSVSAAAASTYQVSAPSSATAGSSVNVTVSAKDAFGNTATGYTGTVHFTSSDGQGVLPSNYTFTASDAGVHTFSATLKTAGSRSITATDTATASVTGSATVSVSAAAASTYQVAAPSSATAGSSVNVTVSAKDAYGNTANGYTGTVHFTSSDGQAVLPANYTFTAGDAGSHTFSVTWKTVGSQSITATDTATGSITGSANVSITTATANSYQVSAPSSATAGSSFNVTVTAKDVFGNTATAYTGTVHFTSSDGLAGLPANYTFTAGDAGVHTFSATLKTAGSRSITATDTATASVTGSATVSVSAAAASTYQVAAPSSATAGSSVNVTVSAKDAYGNTANGYTGTVHFTSSDGQAVLPANYTFTAGDAGSHTFSVTWKTVGSQSITATDTATGSITGSANVSITTATANSYQVSAPSSATAGSSFNVTVTAKDVFGNTATAYTGTVHFTSSDGLAGLPANYTFTAGDAGVHTFSATLKTAGSRSITATDTATASVTGSATVAVNAAAASTYQVSAPSNGTAGSAFNVTVTAKDAFGNTATGYTGTVHFTSSDGQAALPTNYAFTAGDAGVHTFSATLKTSGSRSITATDTATSSIAGSSTISVSAAAASAYQLSAPLNVSAGSAFNVNVTAKDVYGNIATGYTGTVHFTSSDGQAVLPANYAFTAGDAGAHIFSATLQTVGSQSITVTDTADSSINGSQNGIVVAAGDTNPPTVVAKTPSDGATGVVASTNVTATFSEAVQTSTISFILKDSGGNQVAASVTYDAATMTVTLNPTSNLAPNATYTATLSLAQDLAGNTMSPVSWSFTTQAAVVSGNPFAVGTTAGPVTTVTMYNADRTVRFTAQPFGSTHTGGARVALGDVTGDGVADIIAVTNGNTKAQARIIDGATGTVLSNQLLGTTTYTGPVTVAIGDVNGDGVGEVALGTNENGPHARVFRGGDFALLSGFHAGTTSKFLGRTNVALSDMTGDGKAELVVTSLYSTGSRVVGYKGTSLVQGSRPAKAFSAFTLGGGYVNGLFVALGDVNADGKADLVLGSGASAASNVSVFSGQALIATNTRTKIANFAPANGNASTGVKVAVRDVNGDGKADILTSSGEMVTALQGGSGLPANGIPPLLFSFDPDPGLTGGVWIG